MIVKKFVLVFAALLIFGTFGGAAYASDEVFEYENDVLSVSLTTEPNTDVTVMLEDSGGTFIALKQAKSGGDGSFAYTFAFDEEKKDDYTITVSCVDNVYTKTVRFEGRSECSFKYFAIMGINGKISGNKITVTLPDSANLKKLTPSFEVSEYATASVDGEIQISGESEVDFRDDVTYIVTSGGGDTKEYVVSVSKKESSSSGSGGGGGSKWGGGSVVIPPSPAVQTPTDNPTADTYPADGFTDVRGDHWAYSDIMKLKEAKIISDAEFFEPERQVTRAEFAKMAVLAFGLYDENSVCGFEDISDAPWSDAFVGSAVRHGMVNGIGGNRFGFNQSVLRQHAVLILCRALGLDGGEPDFADKSDISDYAYESVGAMQSGGFVNGNEAGRFNPHGNLTRAEAAALINRVRLAQNNGKE